MSLGRAGEWLLPKTSLTQGSFSLAKGWLKGTEETHTALKAEFYHILNNAEKGNRDQIFAVSHSTRPKR